MNTIEKEIVTTSLSNGWQNPELCKSCQDQNPTTKITHTLSLTTLDLSSFPLVSVPVHLDDVLALFLQRGRQAQTQQWEGLLAQRELMSSWDQTTLPWYLAHKYYWIQFWIFDNCLPWLDLWNGQYIPITIHSNSLEFQLMIVLFVVNFSLIQRISRIRLFYICTVFWILKEWKEDCAKIK